MKKIVIAFFLLGILCTIFGGCEKNGNNAATLQSQNNSSMLLLIQNNDLVLYNQDNGAEYIIDDEYISDDTPADLLCTRVYFSENGDTIIYYSKPDDHYRLTILDWRDVCENPDNIVPLRIVDGVELDGFQITPESVGYVANGKLYWYMLAENQINEIVTFDIGEDYYYISEDGTSILVDIGSVYLYAYDDVLHYDKHLHKAYYLHSASVQAHTADLSQFVVDEQLIQYNGWQTTSNEPLSQEAALSWGLESARETRLFHSDAFGSFRTNFHGFNYKLTDPTNPIIGITWNDAENAHQLFTDGLVPFKTNLKANIRWGVFDSIHNLFYVSAGSSKMGWSLYAYTLEKNLIVKETLISSHVSSSALFEPNTGTLFYYESEEDNTNTLCCITDGNTSSPKRIVENAGYPLSQSSFTYNGALQIDAETGRIFCWTDTSEVNSVDHTGTMYEISVDGDVSAETIAGRTGIMSWGIHAGDLYYIGDYSDSSIGTLYRYDGNTSTAIKSGVQGIITNSAHYAYFPGYIY